MPGFLNTASTMMKKNRAPLVQKGLEAFKGWQEKRSAKKKLNTPGNIQAPKLDRLPSVGMSGRGFQGGSAWDKMKKQDLF